MAGTATLEHWGERYYTAHRGDLFHLLKSEFGNYPKVSRQIRLPSQTKEDLWIEIDCVAIPGRGINLELFEVRPGCVQSGAVPPGSVGGLPEQAPEVAGGW